METHDDKRKAQFKRRLKFLSNAIKAELDRCPDSHALGLVFTRDSWQMMRLAMEFSRKTSTKKLPTP